VYNPRTMWNRHHDEENTMNTVTAKNFRSRLGAARSVLLIAGALFAMELAPSAKADTVYTYTGNDYTSCGGTYCTGGPYALAITFDTTLTGSALVNLAFTNITATITSFKFTDGSGLTLDNTNDLVLGSPDIQISTNASGNIVAWFAGAYTFPATTQMQTNWDSPFGFIPGADFSETAPSFAGDFGFLFNDPGTWSMVSTTATPEPSTLLLLATGLLGFGIVLARRVGRIAV
jgi:hypothetical protein